VRRHSDGTLLRGLQIAEGKRQFGNDKNPGKLSGNHTRGREVVEIFGIEKAKLERRGTPLDDLDLVLASCALAHNLTLVTNNVRHFRKIESLRVVNWTEETD